MRLSMRVFAIACMAFGTGCRCGASSGGPGAPDPTPTAVPVADTGPRGLVTDRPSTSHIVPRFPRNLRIQFADEDAGAHDP